MTSKNMGVKLLSLLCILLFGAAGIFYTKFKNAKGDLIFTQLQNDSIIETNNGFKVRLAQEEMTNNEMKDALKAADQLIGRLRSHVRVEIQPQVVHDTISAPIVGNRVVFEDSNAVGKLLEEILVHTDSLGINWSFNSFPITVTVGEVVLRNGRVAFIAKTSTGQVLNLEAPYVQPLEPSKPLTFYVGSGFDMIGRTLYFEGGMRYRIPFVKKLFISASSTQDLSASGQSRFHVGIVKTF